MENRIVKIFDEIEVLNQFAAEKFVELSQKSIERKNDFTVALAGGSTPKTLYRLLTTGEFKDRVEWNRVFFFFGDERNVLPDDDESNFKMANENLFVPLEIKPENVFRWQTESANAEETAADYLLKIWTFYEGRKIEVVQNKNAVEVPRFDLILLGMGDDGHTASLFPHTDALLEKEMIAVANRVEKLNTNRLTLTFPVINAAANVVFLVKGAEKAETLRAVLEGEFQPETLPSQNVRLTNGDLYWLVEKDAARFLND